MSIITNVSPGKVSPAQAAELVTLIELEARWENLRHTPTRSVETRSTTQALQGVQKAYEAFRSKLTAYNKRFAPPYVPELLLNTPLRLALWCRKIRDYYLQIDKDPSVRYPQQLLEKAYRWADLVAAKSGQNGPSRSTSPVDTQEVIRELEMIAQRCELVVKVEAAA